ncbi:uncharacterized protein LOC127122130 [Lathyrus oleraceus]|uniref:uncharacterized protein LOC127122130 n=1 Tax=Pisum sativum TaxID=3888 RepID=UPI0021D3DE90|nr:uncharacterized protein LOC127122130 [Pisum sativum]
MHFNNYVDHRETQPFDDIVLYSGWLACRSRLTAPHLPERMMRKFGYTQTILRHSVVSDPPALTYRQIYAMFNHYESYLVPDETQSTVADSDSSYANGYIRWFFMVSHLYMVHDALGDPLRPAHHEILEEKHAQLDHAKDVLPRCHHILEIAHADIEKGIFLYGYDVRQVLDTIMVKTRETLMYQRQYRRKGVLKVEDSEEA